MRDRKSHRPRGRSAWQPWIDAVEFSKRCSIDRWIGDLSYTNRCKLARYVELPIRVPTQALTNHLLNDIAKTRRVKAIKEIFMLAYRTS